MKKKLGFIVNPIAGMGGRVGLKGTDGLEILERARKMGATPHAPGRAVEALKEIQPYRSEIELFSCPGEMGENEARHCGFEPQLVDTCGGPTTSEDTVTGARKMQALGVDLLLFAGGDGTARDVYRGVGMELPVLGIPAGVKIHSAVFAVNPKSAGKLALSYLKEKEIEVKEAEVMDIDEEAFRKGRLTASLYGYLRVPFENTLLQGLKSGAIEDEKSALEAAAEYLAEKMQKEVLYIVGPGTSTLPFMEKLGLSGTLLGVDVVSNGQLVAADVNERQLLELLKHRNARILVSVIGGQGYIFGRGNQQISAAVIKKVGRENIIVIATKNKIASLEGHPLLVDTGEEEADFMMKGYLKVVTGYEEELIYRVNQIR